MTIRRDIAQEEAREFAELAKSAGYRVALAERGTHGFFTNDTGRPVVSFQCDGLATISLSGNYRPERSADGRQLGTGWQLSDETPATVDQVHAVFEAAKSPPHWATRGLPVRLMTRDEHLDAYPASRFADYE